MPTKFVVDAFIDTQMKLCAYVSLNARRRCTELRLGQASSLSASFTLRLMVFHIC